jgi:hypothetical protein
LVELPPITEKRWRNFLFCSAGCFLLRDEGFSFGLDVLYWDLEISKLQFLIKKQVLIFSSDEFFKFSEIKPLDPGSQHWFGENLGICLYMAKLNSKLYEISLSYILNRPAFRCGTSSCPNPGEPLQQPEE